MAGHLQGREAVERGEGGVSKVVRHGLRGGHARGALPLHRRDDRVALDRLVVGKMGAAGRSDAAALQNVERPLELRDEVRLEQPAGALRRSLDRVACRLVHASRSPIRR